MAEAVAVLVSLGYSFSEVLHLTVTQIYGLIEVGFKIERERLGNYSFGVRMAFHAEGKQFDKFLKGD